jgi:hypothetical protein
MLIKMLAADNLRKNLKLQSSLAAETQGFLRKI